ncbi:MAG: hypothetical protein IBX72_06700 [Nitrospirae bacterium]|jgi:hypothetical protein|nr:hypothetical protein [Nitrospirota bacterium]
MPGDLTLRKELKEKFIQDLNPSEQFFFLKKAREVIMLRGYPACEDLYHYCYFLTIKERFRCISTEGAGGLLRFLLVEGSKDVEEAISLYEERLEKKRLPVPDIEGYKFLEFFSE